MALVNECIYIADTDIQRRIAILPTHDMVGLYITSPIPDGLVHMDILHMTNKNHDIPILRCPTALLKYTYDTKKNILELLLINTCRIPYSKMECGGPLKLRFHYDIGYPHTIPLVKIDTSPGEPGSRNSFIRIPIFHIDSKPCTSPPTLSEFDKICIEKIYKQSSIIQQASSTHISNIYPFINDKWYVTPTELWIIDQTSIVPSYCN